MKLATETFPSSAEPRRNLFAELWICAERARWLEHNTYFMYPPSYYRAEMDESRLGEYYIAVADESPVPILLYSYPGAVAGIDMDSDFIMRLAKHRNIVGTKFTCGNTGKLTRVASATDTCTPRK